MPYILVIDKLGAIKETNIKEYKEEDLYKKANFKSAEGFALQTIWTGLSSDISVSVYGKKTGKAGQENKYEFPPPIDSVLFFGGCVLIAKSELDDSIVDLRVSSWNNIYDTLMGGFEDLDLDHEEEEDEDDPEVQDLNLIGKNGYMKDGFVVEDDDVEFEEDREDLVEEEEDELVEEEEEKPKKKPKRKLVEKKGEKEKKKSEKDKKKKSMEKEGSMLDFSAAVTDNYLDCSSELVEEEYV
jgi:hypothetical protein